MSAQHAFATCDTLKRFRTLILPYSVRFPAVTQKENRLRRFHLCTKVAARTMAPCSNTKSALYAVAHPLKKIEKWILRDLNSEPLHGTGD